MRLAFGCQEVQIAQRPSHQARSHTSTGEEQSIVHRFSSEDRLAGSRIERVGGIDP